MPPLGWKKETAPKVSKYDIAKKYRSKPEVKARLAADKRRLRALDPEKYRIRVRENWNKNREQRNAQKKIYTALNKDVISIRLARDYEKNKAKRKESMRQWRKNNPEHDQALGHAKRARKKRATIGSTKIITQWIKSWRAKEEVRCFWCLNFFHPSQCCSEHMIALDLGGPHCIENLAISCKRCNNRKKNKTIERWNQQIEQPVLMLFPMFHKDFTIVPQQIITAH